MEHAIESLRKHIRTAAEMFRAFPNDDELKRDIYAMVSAVNVMEIYRFGHHVTKYNDIIKEELK